jgi:hypothetical protein
LKKKTIEKTKIKSFRWVRKRLSKVFHFRSFGVAKTVGHNRAINKVGGQSGADDLLWYLGRTRRLAAGAGAPLLVLPRLEKLLALSDDALPDPRQRLGHLHAQYVGNPRRYSACGVCVVCVK